MHGLVGVHVLAVEHGHAAQRLEAVELLVLVEAVKRAHLPGGSVLHGHAAALDHVEQTLPVGGVDARLLQALVRGGQQPAEHELGRRDLAHAGPVEAGVDALPSAGVEVVLGG